MSTAFLSAMTVPVPRFWGDSSKSPDHMYLRTNRDFRSIRSACKDCPRPPPVSLDMIAKCWGCENYRRVCQFCRESFIVTHPALDSGFTHAQRGRTFTDGRFVFRRVLRINCRLDWPGTGARGSRLLHLQRRVRMTGLVRRVQRRGRGIDPADQSGAGPSGPSSILAPRRKDPPRFSPLCGRFRE